MSLNASFAPNESSAYLLLETTKFISVTVLSSTAFGILFTLYVFCLAALVPQLKIRANRALSLFNIVFCTAIFIFVGVGKCSNAFYAQQVWIDNRNYPGGPAQFIFSEGSIAVLVWGWGVYIVASWLQDAYVIYRCLVFWEWNYYVCALPIACYFASVSTSIALLVEIKSPAQGITGPITTDLAICWYVFSVSVNILGTIAIVGRLIWKRRSIISVLGKEHSKVYVGVVAMLVESAALYSVFGIIFIATHFSANSSVISANFLVLPTLGTIEGICPLMIVYRVASGRGWTNATNHRINNSLPTIDFKTNPGICLSSENPSSPTMSHYRSDEFDNEFISRSY